VANLEAACFVLSEKNMELTKTNGNSFLRGSRGRMRGGRAEVGLR